MFTFSFYIFHNINNEELNRNFLKTMKIYSLNSFVYCTNLLVMGVYWVTSTTVLYENDAWITQFTPDYKFMSYWVYICTNLGTTSYAFGSVMEIYITWSKILVFKPNYKFLLTTSVIIIPVLDLKKKDIVFKFVFNLRSTK